MEKEPRSEHTFRVAYRLSKDHLAKYIDYLYETRRFESADFRARTHRAGAVGGFIYDLGHYGRGLDEFDEMSLTTPPPK